MGPTRSPSISIHPDGRLITPRVDSGTRSNVLRASKCSLVITSPGLRMGVATIPRRWASSATSSMVMVANSSSYSGLSTASAIMNRLMNPSYSGSCR